MTHRSTPRSNRRKAIVVGAIAAALLPLGMAAPAFAAGGPGSDTAVSAASRTVKADPVAEVKDFYGKYITARGKNDVHEASELRNAHLTTGFQQDLATWEREHGADGVTRSQNVPVKAEVTYDGSGMGHSWAIVTLKWKSRPDTKLHIQSDLETKKISDIKDL